MTERRIAVLIGNCEYPNFPKDELPELTTPKNDIRGLDQTLRDRARGAFTSVECLEDAEAANVREQVEQAIIEASQPNTLGLIFYSGHGLLDSTGSLHLAMRDSKPNSWNRTLPVRDIAHYISLHNPQRLVILLDCCYSGAALGDMEFKGTTPRGSVREVVDRNLQELQGKGVVMITATTSIQQAAAKVNGLGVFTKCLLEGLSSGSARKGNRSCVTIRDLYTYLSRQLVDQTPMFWGAQSGGDLVISGTQLLGQNSRPSISRPIWSILKQERKPVLDLIGPTYLLDRNYHFLDWNPAFEIFVAHPLKLKRGQHVASFLQKLSNFRAVEKRSNERFRPNYVPPVDIEVLEFSHPEFGLIVFDKIASQIIGTGGRLRAWSVALNVQSVQRRSEFWAKMEVILSRDQNWTKYAMNYDRIISSFSEYQGLADTLVNKLPSAATNCLDLGAGTGSVTLKILKKFREMRVVAIEKNEAMCDCFQRNLDLSGSSCTKQRALLYKGDITTRLQQEDSDSFDACVMLNVLFSLEHPVEVLAEVFRVLKVGGVMTLSTSHSRTDVRHLFGEIKNELHKKGNWDEVAERAWQDAFERNLEMEDMIKRDSLTQIEEMIVGAGFTIEEFSPGHYVDCVVIVKAIKASNSGSSIDAARALKALN